MPRYRTCHSGRSVDRPPSCAVRAARSGDRYSIRTSWCHVFREEWSVKALAPARAIQLPAASRRRGLGPPRGTRPEGEPFSLSSSGPPEVEVGRRDKQGRRSHQTGLCEFGTSKSDFQEWVERLKRGGSVSD